jgi:hypothetical protein
VATKKPQVVYSNDLPNEAISFDIEAFDNLLRSQGVTFIHYRGTRCPVGMIDEFDTRRPHEDHEGCSNGFLYTKAGEITCLFNGNGTSTSLQDVGVVDGSTVSVTLPRFYDDSTEPVRIAAFDRMYLSEIGISVSFWQLFRHSPSGIDKLSFPVSTVQDLIDSQGKRYFEGDFEIRADGKLAWTAKKPGLDPETGKGLVCSVRYTYRPYWYVKQLVHEVRVTQAEDPLTGARVINRMPQAVVLQREYVFENADRDEQAKDPNDPRQAQASDGSF